MRSVPKVRLLVGGRKRQEAVVRRQKKYRDSW